jgi:hypothetical protein
MRRLAVLALAVWVMAGVVLAGEEPKAADEEGFVSLFNGKDLTGWVGSVKGYSVEDGIMVCRKEGGGNLYTEKEYADFHFKFDFKLETNANNGAGIRAPLQGNAAYQGMEIQILDDSGSAYTKLQPYQYHGSIYGVVACKRGHQKPVGEWNSEEIIAKGTKITVILNGVTIVDADLQPFIDGKEDTADHGGIKGHPGLKNEKGHIGWLGHGSRIEFRNIRVKELK